MAVVDREVFVRLNHFWEEIFESPKEVALGAEYLPNVLGSAIGALKAYRNDEEDDVELGGKNRSRRRRRGAPPARRATRRSRGRAARLNAQWRIQ